MKDRIGFLTVMIIIAALIAGPVLAEGPGEGPAGRGGEQGFKNKKMAIERELKLTPEQDKLLKDAKEAHRAEMAGLVKALKEKRRELKEALAKPGVTRQQLEPITAEMKQLQSQMIDARMNGILRVKEILTPEQYQKLQSMKEEWQNKPRGKHFGKGRGE